MSGLQGQMSANGARPTSSPSFRSEASFDLDRTSPPPGLCLRGARCIGACIPHKLVVNGQSLHSPVQFSSFFCRVDLSKNVAASNIYTTAQSLEPISVEIYG